MALRSISSIINDANFSETRQTAISLPDGWDDLTKQFGGGLWPGVHVLVGGPGVGKTTFALQVALSAALKGNPVAYVCLNDEPEQIALRVMAEVAKAPWPSIYFGQSAEHIRGVKAAAESLKGIPFHIVKGEPGKWEAMDLYGIASALKTRYSEPEKGLPPGMIVVDYLQMVGDERHQDNTRVGLDIRERTIRAVYHAKEAARLYNVAIVMISSTSRQHYETLRNVVNIANLTETSGRGVVGNPEALLGTAKESGEIESVVDTVSAFCPMAVAKGQPEDEICTLLVTAKNRLKAPGWSVMRFQRTTFVPGPFARAEVIRRSKKANAQPKGKSKRKALVPPPPTLDHDDYDA